MANATKLFLCWAVTVCCFFFASCRTPLAEKPGGNRQPGVRVGVRSGMASEAAPVWTGSRESERDAAGFTSAQPMPFPEKLGLRDAFLLVLGANKDVRVASLLADASRERVTAAKGEFDPAIFMELTRGRSKVPAGTALVTSPDVAQGAYTAGVRQRAPTGTTLEVTASTDYERDITGASALSPSYGPAVKVALQQDVLKDFGLGINRTNILLARNNWQVSREGLRGTLIESLFQVERAYWDLYFSLADLKVREKQLERAHRLVQIAEAQVGVGLSAPLDVVRAKSSAAAQAVPILQARNNITKLRRALLRLLGVLDIQRAEWDFQLADEPPHEAFETSLAQAVEVARKARPDYLQARLRVDNAGLQRRFFKNQRLPTLQLFGEYGLSGLGEDFSSGVDSLEEGRFSSWLVGLRFELPIPNRTGRSDYKAAQFEHRRAEVQLDGLVERITREVADAIADLQTAEESTVAAAQARELAERKLRAEEKSFSLGRATSLDVLDAHAAMAAAERDEIRARADYAIALANLFRVEGVLLKKKRIAFVEGMSR